MALSGLEAGDEVAVHLEVPNPPERPLMQGPVPLVRARAGDENGPVVPLALTGAA